MNSFTIQHRLVHLPREWPVRACPALLLAVCVAFAVVLALLAGAASAQPTRTSDAAPAFDAAMVAYERNHWDEAFAALARLADRGHPEAARMALQMWRFGPKLYQTDFSASAAQVERWTQLWSCSADAASGACRNATQAR